MLLPIHENATEYITIHVPFSSSTGPFCSLLFWIRHGSYSVSPSRIRLTRGNLSDLNGHLRTTCPISSRGCRSLRRIGRLYSRMKFTNFVTFGAPYDSLWNEVHSDRNVIWFPMRLMPKLSTMQGRVRWLSSTQVLELTSGGYSQVKLMAYCAWRSLRVMSWPHDDNFLHRCKKC